MILDDPQYYVQSVLEGNRRRLAKTITLIESSLPAHQELSREIVDLLLPYSGKSIRVGISGVPGVGKSTFIESFGMMLITKGHKVAVLAVDPSSVRSGGSVMADKTRMEKLAIEANAFIRPSPSGGTLGGVARKTRETMLICEAAGYDALIIETVGVGQSEITVASMVDFFLVLMLAGAGDEFQGIKKGILEIADAIVINKADGDNIENAKRAQRIYETALSLIIPSTPSWKPPVLTCSAMEMTGIDTIWETILEYWNKFHHSGDLEEKRRRQSLAWMWSLIDEGLKERFFNHPAIKNKLPKIKTEVEKGIMSPTVAACNLLFSLDKN